MSWYDIMFTAQGDTVGSHPNIASDGDDCVTSVSDQKRKHVNIGSKYKLGEDNLTMNNKKVKSNLGCFGGFLSMIGWIIEDFR